MSTLHGGWGVSTNQQLTGPIVNIGYKHGDILMVSPPSHGYVHWGIRDSKLVGSPGVDLPSPREGSLDVRGPGASGLLVRPGPVWGLGAVAGPPGSSPNLALRLKC